MPGTGSTLIPALRYRDAHAAIDFLCRAFGLTKKAVYEGADGSVAHAELVLESATGRGMIMLGTSNNSTEYGKQMSLVDENGCKPTSTLYLVVPDAEAVYATAQEAGATILSPLTAMEYGGKAFNCKDPEGNLWTVGEYDPWA